MRAVVDNLSIPGQFPEVKREIESEFDTAKLYKQLENLDPDAAKKMESTNRRRVVRALEVTLGSGKPFSQFGPGMDSYPPTPFTQIGLQLSRETIDKRISERYEQQIANGFLEEVETVMAKGISRTAAPALGYKEFYSHLRGECSLEEATEKAVIATRRFARRQERWFRRDPRIKWLEVTEDPSEVLLELLEIFDKANKN